MGVAVAAAGVSGGSPPASPPLFSTQYHTSQNQAISLSRKGRLLRLATRGEPRPKAKEWKRGRVTGFSARSRARIFQKMATVERSAYRGALFLTLTYPRVFPHDPKVWKAHLDVFGKEVRKKYPRCSMIWKLEPQPRRKAPHFHLLIFGVQFIPHDWFKATWYLTVDSGSWYHLEHGAFVVAIENPEMGMRYVGKYIAKQVWDVDTETGEVTDWEYPGRWWGVIGRKHLPTDLIHWGVKARPWFLVKRALRKYFERQRKPWNFRDRGGGYVLMDGEQAYRLIRCFDATAFDTLHGPWPVAR